MQSFDFPELVIDVMPAMREGLDLEENSEKLLVARFVRGDRDAFDQILALHAPRVTRLAYRLLGWQGDPDDVTQDVFLAALESGHRFRGDTGLGQWLSTITLNKCRSRIRRRILRLNWLRNRSLDEPCDSPADRGALRDETSARVRAAVSALPAKDREVIVLYYLEDRCVAQISQITGMSSNAIDVRLHRARKRLKEMLKRFVDSDMR